MSFKWLRFVLVFALLAIGLGGTLTAQDADGGERPVITADNVGELTELYRFGRGNILSVKVNPDGSTLAVGSTMGIWLYDLENPDLTVEPPLLPAQEGAINGLMTIAYNADGTLLAMGADNHIVIWDTETLEIVRTVYLPEDVRSMVFAPDEAGVIVGTRNGELIPLDYETWTVDDENTIPEEEPEFDAFSIQSRDLNRLDYNPERTLIAGTGLNVPVVVVDTETYEVVFTTPQGRVNDFAFSPDGSTFLVMEASTEVYLYDTETWELIWEVTPSTPLSAETGTFNSSGANFLIIDATNAITVHDTATGMEQRVIELDPDRELPLGIMITMAFNTAGTKLVLVQERGGAADEILIADIATGTVEAITGAHVVGMNAVDFSPTDAQLTFSDIFFQYVWSVRDSTEIDALPRIEELRVRNDDSGLDVTSYSPDGSAIIRLGVRAVNVYEAETLDLRFSVPIEGMLDSLVFPDGELLLVGGTSTGNFGGVLDMTTGEVLFEFGDDAFGGALYSVALSADGTMIAVASQDHSVRVFGIPQ